jgi:hypothetical protein
MAFSSITFIIIQCNFCWKVIAIRNYISGYSLENEDEGKIKQIHTVYLFSTVSISNWHLDKMRQDFSFSLIK